MIVMLLIKHYGINVDDYDSNKDDGSIIDVNDNNNNNDC